MSASEGNSGDSTHGSHAHGPPPPPEPKTPMWLPAVGAVLFLTVGLLWALSSPSKAAEEPGSAAAAGADAGAEAAAP